MKDHLVLAGMVLAVLTVPFQSASAELLELEMTMDPTAVSSRGAFGYPPDSDPDEEWRTAFRFDDADDVDPSDQIIEIPNGKFTFRGDWGSAIGAYWDETTTGQSLRFGLATSINGYKLLSPMYCYNSVNNYLHLRTDNLFKMIDFYQGNENNTLMGTLSFDLHPVDPGGTCSEIDTVDWSDGQADTYFLPPAANPGAAPYRRWSDQDWSWTHTLTPPASIYRATLEIEAYDIDPTEVHQIYADGVLLGSLVGSYSVWSTTTFNLDAAALDQLADGTLGVLMDIDGDVTLRSSKLTVNSGCGTVANTPPGEDVCVPGPNGEQICFPTVEEGGDTEIKKLPDCPPWLCYLLKFSRTAVLWPCGECCRTWELYTSAQYSGNIVIGLPYACPDIPPRWEPHIKMRHHKVATDTVEDITVWVDTDNDMVYGLTSHLSLFALTVGVGVEIDIKPGSDPNPINQGSNGLIPVAILSRPDFDATTVDPPTVELGGSNVAVRGKGKSMAHEEDVDGDGLIDLVVQVETTGFDEVGEDGTVVLTGETFEGEPIVGGDLVVIIPAE